MANNKKIAAHYDSNTKHIIIDEESSPGDFIDISSFSLLDELINDKLNEKYKASVINEFKSSDDYKSIEKAANESNSLNQKIVELQKNHQQELEKTAKNAVNEFKASPEYSKLQGLEENNKQLIQSFEREKQQLKLNAVNEFKVSPEYIKLQGLEATNKQLIESFEKERQQLKVNAVNEFKVSPDFTNLVEHNRKLQNDLENSYFKNVEEYKKTPEYTDLLDIKNRYERRLTANSKVLGEELENECEKMFSNYFQQVDDVELEKTTTAIYGKKPDFLFKVFSSKEHNDQNLIAQVVLEMKTDKGQSKTKNSQHFEILETNRKNFNAEFGLLVTNLELHDDFVIKKAQGYENIFLVRPNHFVYVLVLFRLIYLKCKQLMDSLNINVADKDQISKIIARFVDFKENLFQQSIKNIETQLEAILTATTAIKKQTEKIEISVETIKNSHLNTVKNKIEEFSKDIIKQNKKLTSD